MEENWQGRYVRMGGPETSDWTGGLRMAKAGTGLARLAASGMGKLAGTPEWASWGKSLGALGSLIDLPLTIGGNAPDVAKGLQVAGDVARLGDWAAGTKWGAEIPGLSEAAPYFGYAGPALGIGSGIFSATQGNELGGGLQAAGNAAALGMMFVPGLQPFAPLVSLGSSLFSRLGGKEKSHAEREGEEVGTAYNQAQRLAEEVGMATTPEELYATLQYWNEGQHPVQQAGMTLGGRTLGELTSGDLLSADPTTFSAWLSAGVPEERLTRGSEGLTRAIQDQLGLLQRAQAGDAEAQALLQDRGEQADLTRAGMLGLATNWLHPTGAGEALPEELTPDALIREAMDQVAGLKGYAPYAQGLEELYQELVAGGVLTPEGLYNRDEWTVHI